MGGMGQCVFMYLLQQRWLPAHVVCPANPVTVNKDNHKLTEL